MAAQQRLVFIDTGVLIAAARGKAELAERAMTVFDDPTLRFASSPFVRLEVLPKSIYNGRTEEVDFYEAFFLQVAVWVPVTKALLTAAYAEAVRAGLSAVDAIHVASANAVGADELITTEAPNKPLLRATLVSVRTLHP